MPAVARVAGSGLAGAGVALAFPPYDAVPLMPLGLAGLMLAVGGTRGRVAALHGLVFGLGFMLPLLRWITVIGTDAWLALGLLEASFYAVMALGWGWLRPLRWWPLGIALTWVAAEALRSAVPFGGLPWGRLAFALVDTPLVRLGRLGGPALVSFVVVAAVAALVNAAERGSRDVRSAALAGAALAVLALTALIPVGAASATGTVRVAAVQGNVPGEGMDAFAERRAVLDNHATATSAFAARVADGTPPRPDLVIWPENSSDIDPFRDRTAYRQIDTAVRSMGVPTLVGTIVNGPDQLHVQNMGVVWDPVNGPGERYVKRHPVPFGEYIPFRKLLSAHIERLEQIPRDFARGEEAGVLRVGPVTVGDVICFEVAYDGLLRDVVDGGAQLLVVQTNNATYTGTGQLEQQFAISRYRAIETGRTVVVAATNGISGIVAPDGSVRARTEIKTQAVLAEDVPLADGRTWGVRVGGVLEWLLAAAGAVAAIAAYAIGGRGRAPRLRG